MNELMNINNTISTVKGNAIDVINLYISTLKSPSTKKQYTTSIKYFLEFIYNRDIETLTTNDLILDGTHATAYQGYLMDKLEKKEFKRSTYNSRIKGVKKFYEWLIFNTTSNRGNYSAFIINPFKCVNLLSESDSDGSEPFTLEEVKMLLKHPYGRNKHIQERNALMLEMGIETGIRLNALMSLTADDIEVRDNITLVTVQDKNDKLVQRDITRLHDRLMGWYHRDLAMRIGRIDTLFGIANDTANREIKKWCKTLGINKKITFHSLRTTTATLVYKNTNSIGRTQLALNHSNTSTTKVYLDKEKKINTDTGNLLADIENKSTLALALEGMTKEQIIQLINNLPADTQYTIQKALEKEKRTKVNAS